MSRKRHDFDAEATEAMRFADPRSYVTHSGKEFRFSDDMREIRERVYNRDHCHCVLCLLPLTLNTMHLDHHPVSRGRLGDDSMENLRTLCAPCHSERHVKPM